MAALGLRLWWLSVVVVWCVSMFTLWRFWGAEDGFCSRYTLRVVLSSDSKACSDGASGIGSHVSSDLSFSVHCALQAASGWALVLVV